MNSPAVKDLSAIPQLAADDPVIIAFSARRDLGVVQKQPATTPCSSSVIAKSFVLIGVIDAGNEDASSKLRLFYKSFS